MDNCFHQSISNSGSNDIPCVCCRRYPVLKLRYRCNQCIKESCGFCLIDFHQLPPETSQAIRPPNRFQTLELRLISLENLIDEIQEKLKQLEAMIRKLWENYLR